ncbi:bifunctional DNA-formamidopyrimidine glycosylase/DNA-(apurinic or apyrimidinic site) lyase [Ahrensia sp. 13_GOM-1096m]|uniref:bifunctional DNA-formamidopyrimidine glycosylase/DNA-(apurinic or apyrimidinic site) lyase n=1 Tax=Ahrensia sp. 13_GOM-1096m TaxID=1380380 RepID=UPI00047A95DD|nr:bifunctional DNA-formamidopyrimidine glycosylase/DNA-(apurinic or apyrimidinic site) lyase [Ahrensia sp. 13_GOM-1096m]
MPELPEVETVRRGLEPVMQGAMLERLELRRPNLRFPFPDNMAVRLQGVKITSLSRRAKYLMIHFDNGFVLVCHLGMSGSFRTQNSDIGERHHEHAKIEAHDHVIFHLKQSNDEQAQVIYNDPRRFGFMFMDKAHLIHENPHLSGLGLEPTGNQLSGEALAPMFAGKAAPLKAALLDQKLIAGLGNIYVCEALWRSGLSPKRKAGTLVRKDGKPTARCNELAGHIRTVIADAIQAGGSSLRDHTQTDGTLGYFQHSFAVYDQEGMPCRKQDCGGTINRIVQSGRSTFYCPTCQR